MRRLVNIHPQTLLLCLQIAHKWLKSVDIGSTPYSCPYCNKSFGRSDVRAKHVSTMHRGGESRESDGESSACVEQTILHQPVKSDAYLCTLHTENHGGFRLTRLLLAVNSLRQALLLLPRSGLCQVLRCRVPHTCFLLCKVPVFQLIPQKTLLIREEYLMRRKTFWDLTPTCKGSNMVSSQVVRHLQIHPLGPLSSLDKVRQVAGSLILPV